MALFHSFFKGWVIFHWCFPGGLLSKESACNAGDMGSIPGSERYPGKRNSNPLQYSCLENPMDRGAWRATVHGVEIVGHNLETKPPPPIFHLDLNAYFMLEINSAEMLDPRVWWLHVSQWDETGYALPCKQATWCVGYFELKIFETQKTQEKLITTPLTA